MLAYKDAATPKRKGGVGSKVLSALWLWARTGPHGTLFFLRTGLRLWLANMIRRRKERRLGRHLPKVLIVSPTMRCNYSCKGCYSRSRPEDDELTTVELDNLLAEAEKLGFMAVLLTGGEPLMRDDLLELITRRKMLFVIITNGTTIDNETARRISRSGNIITLVSVEGFAGDTDERRGEGSHSIALNAMKHLRSYKVPFGFSVTGTALNYKKLGSPRFIDDMISYGCIAGLFSEYVPCGPEPRAEWVMSKARRNAFQEQVQELRSTRPIVLVQFPQDEYGEANRCTAAGQSSLHINAQGGIEPCPFVPVAVENIRQGGLLAAIHSPFFQAIREKPHLLKHDRYACSLFEHLQELESMAEKIAGP